MIIADTGPLVAIANDQDKYHEACMTLLEEHPGLAVVPALIVLEVCQVLASRRGTRSETSFLNSVAAGELRLIDMTSADHAKAAAGYRRRIGNRGGGAAGESARWPRWTGRTSRVALLAAARHSDRVAGLVLRQTQSHAARPPTRAPTLVR